MWKKFSDRSRYYSVLCLPMKATINSASDPGPPDWPWFHQSSRLDRFSSTSEKNVVYCMLAKSFWASSASVIIWIMLMSYNLSLHLIRNSLSSKTDCSVLNTTVALKLTFFNELQSRSDAVSRLNTSTVKVSVKQSWPFSDISSSWRYSCEQIRSSIRSRQFIFAHQSSRLERFSLGIKVVTPCKQSNTLIASSTDLIKPKTSNTRKCGS